MSMTRTATRVELTGPSNGGRNSRALFHRAAANRPDSAVRFDRAAVSLHDDTAIVRHDADNTANQQVTNRYQTL